jgi:hypothetical protein
MRRLLLAFGLALIVAGASRAQGPTDPCADSSDPLLGVLAAWVHAEDSTLGYDYCAFATGASLSLGYSVSEGLVLPLRQKLLWAGNLFSLSDSLYVPELPGSMAEAHSLLIAAAIAGEPSLLLARQPLVIYGADSSFGDPWFFVAFCDSTGIDSTIWDRSDLRSAWWRWTDLSGANTIWRRPQNLAVKLGRSAVRRGMRSLVLAARPDSSATQHFGLSALQAAQMRPHDRPGAPERLLQITRLRAAAASFLTEQIDLWPPSQRDPVKLAAYYFQKATDAWRTLATVATTWDSYDEAQRRDWLAAVAEWETKAAIALDEIVATGESR